MLDLIQEGATAKVVQHLIEFPTLRFTRLVEVCCEIQRPLRLVRVEMRQWDWRTEMEQ
jgi:hypothetical protein